MHIRWLCQADLPLEEMWSIENRSGRRIQFSGGVEMDATTAAYIYLFLSLSLSSVVDPQTCTLRSDSYTVPCMRMKTCQFCRGIWCPTVLMILLAAPRMVLAVPL